MERNFSLKKMRPDGMRLNMKIGRRYTLRRTQGRIMMHPYGMRLKM
jgi:hypothetical protein